MESKQNTIIVSLGRVYDVAKLGEIMSLSKSISVDNIQRVIIDAHELTDVNVMGLEILMLKDKILNSNKYSLVFVGLKPETAEIFDMLDDEKEYRDLMNFSSVDEAIAFLNSVDKKSV